MKEATLWASNQPCIFGFSFSGGKTRVIRTSINWGLHRCTKSLDISVSTCSTIPTNSRSRVYVLEAGLTFPTIRTYRTTTFASCEYEEDKHTNPAYYSYVPVIYEVIYEGIRNFYANSELMPFGIPSTPLLLGSLSPENAVEILPKIRINTPQIWLQRL